MPLLFLRDGVKKTSLLVLLAILFSGCSDSTSPWFRPPDYSTVPDAVDTTGVEPVTQENGLTWYVIREGDGRWTVQARDIIEGFLTMRSSDGEVLQSTWASSNTTPESITVSTILENGTEGLYQGVLGMRNGEFRVIVVTPEHGYGDIPNHPFREDTLIYEIEVMDIRQR